MTHGRMLRLVVSILFLSLLPIFGIADPIEPSEEAVSTLDFKMYGGLILFKLEVNGQQKSFLLDSGAPSVILNQKVKESSAVFLTVEGEVRAQEGEIEEIRIGNILRTKVPTWIMDLSHIEKRLGITIDGLIGADLLSSYDLLIDYKLQKISFLSPGNMNELKPVFSKVIALPFVSYYDNLPVIALNRNGQELLMSFDTGAGITVLAEDLLEKGTSVLEEISLGSLKVQSVPVVSSDMSQFVDEEGNRLDGILSVNSLNADSVLISSKRQTIFLFWDNSLE
ncbi:MAG: hypothetical protein ACJA01_003473 [Saprospiraceae bacterium]|jgi:hypothetical protein